MARMEFRAAAALPVIRHLRHPARSTANGTPSRATTMGVSSRPAISRRNKLPLLRGWSSSRRGTDLSGGDVRRGRPPPSPSGAHVRCRHSQVAAGTGPFTEEPISPGLSDYVILVRGRARVFCLHRRRRAATRGQQSSPTRPVCRCTPQSPRPRGRVTAKTMPKSGTDIAWLVMASCHGTNSRPATQGFRGSRVYGALKRGAADGLSNASWARTDCRIVDDSTFAISRRHDGLH